MQLDDVKKELNLYEPIFTLINESGNLVLNKMRENGYEGKECVGLEAFDISYQNDEDFNIWRLSIHGQHRLYIAELIDNVECLVDDIEATTDDSWRAKFVTWAESIRPMNTDDSTSAHAYAMVSMITMLNECPGGVVVYTDSDNYLNVYSNYSEFRRGLHIKFFPDIFNEKAT